MTSTDAQPPQTPQGPPAAPHRRPLPWLLTIAALAVIALAVALLVPGGPLNADPGDPSPSDSESDPGSPTGTPTDPSPSDDPSSDPASPTGTGSPSDAPGTASPSAPTDPTDPATPSAPGSGAGSRPAISTAPGELTEEDASALLENALVPPVAEAESVQALDDLMGDAVMDAYAEELEAQWLELSSQGWSVTGAPTISSLEITSLENSSQPATAEVLACIDSSDVTIVDAEGTPVGDPDAVMARAQHRFTMIQAEDGIWRISSRAFPDAPDC